MNRMKRILCGGLVFTLLTGALAGCEKKPAADDMAYQMTGIPRDATMMTVNGQKVSTEEYLFWLNQSISMQKQYGNLQDDASWETETDGKTAAQYVKDDALETLKYYYVIASKAKEYGVDAMSEEQSTDLNTQIDNIAQTMESQNLTLQQYLNMQAISEQGFRDMMGRLNYAPSNLRTKLSEEGGPLVPTDEEMDSFLSEEGLHQVKHILLTTRRETGETNEYGAPVYEDFSEAETAQVKEQADALVAEIRAAEDPAALFDEKMNELSDDGRDADGNLAAPDGYLVYEGANMDPDFLSAALALDVGEISDPVKSQFGYHIILGVDADTDETRSYFPDYKMNQLVEEWVAAADVKVENERFDAIDAKDFSTKLTSLQDEYIAQAQAQASASPSVDPSADPSASAQPETSDTPAESPTPSAAS